MRVPDGIHGVWIGARFIDFGDRSGSFAKTPARWYAYETVLSGAMVNDYTEADIAAGLTTVTDALTPYIAAGCTGRRSEDDELWLQWSDSEQY